MFVEEGGICFFVSLCCEFDANTFEAILVLVTEVLFSSGIALVALCFIRPWASAFSLSQSLKSWRVGLNQCFLTVKSDHDSFMFGGNFCTAWLSREALFKSASYDSDLKTPTGFGCRIVIDVITIVHFKRRKIAYFIQVCTYDCLWLAKFTF